jgi:hypothetical protein
MEDSRWDIEGLKYPPLSSAGDDIYHYRLYLLYKENPQEAADRIIRLARALEEVRG